MPWADDADTKAELPKLADRYESEIDANGHKTVTTFRTNEKGERVKVMQTVKVSKKTIKIPKAVLVRRKWEKFGEEKSKPAGYHGQGFSDSGTTVLDANEQTLEMAPKEKVMEETNESAQRAFEKMNIGGQFEAWRPKQRDGGELPPGEDAPPQRFGRIPEAEGGGGSSLASLAARSGGASGYVPPSMRNADGSRNAELANQRDDSCTVRVSNLSEDVKDSDLRELFRRFGAIQRIYLAKDRDTHQSRGFAFINFFDRSDAQRAIDKLDRHGYDNLILSVSWANPDAKPAPTAYNAMADSSAAPRPGESMPPRPGDGSGSRFSALSTNEGQRDVSRRFDSHVFDSRLDSFR